MLLYMSYVLTRCIRNPSLGPPMPKTSAQERSALRVEALKSVVMPAAIAFMVLGTIYGGVASVTEAASMGVFGVLAATVIRGDRSKKSPPLEPQLTIFTGADKSLVEKLKWPKNLIVESEILGVAIIFLGTGIVLMAVGGLTLWRYLQAHPVTGEVTG